MGEKSNDEVKKFLENAEISCVPSKWEEPLSLSVLESLAAGCALITSRRGGIPEIAHGSSILLDDVRPSTIANALVDLIEDSSKRKKIQTLAWSNYKYTAKNSAFKTISVRENLLF